MNVKSKKKTLNKFIKALIVIGVLAALVLTVLIIDRNSNKTSVKIDVSEAQKMVDDTFAGLPKTVAYTALAVRDGTTIKVNSLRYGTEKDIILDCSYSTVNVESVVAQAKDELFSKAYGIYLKNNSEGKKTNATSLMLEMKEIFAARLADAEALEGRVDIYIYQMHDGSLKVYLDDAVVNTVFGGIIDAKRDILSVNEIEYNGETVSISNLNTVRTGISDSLSLKNYDSTRPNTGTPLMLWLDDISDEFVRNFVVKDQWMYLAKGLLTTIEITFCALLIGIVIGFLVAIVRVTNLKTGKLGFVDVICKLYISVIRGTPVMVQLLIIYFVLLLPIGIEKFWAAVICFGLNSGAYVAEIVRGGIMSVDGGQTEAGRSLGFNYSQTMFYIVVPQAFKAVLPALANEFITLLKESSVAFYIGVADLTQGGLKIRSITYSNFMPLIAVALIYLVVVLGLSYLVSLLERRMQKGDR